MTRKPKQRIAIIDDEQPILDVVSRFLDQEGYEVSTYTSPQHALDSLTSFHPDLIITDVRLGNETGLDVLKTVKQFNPEINVILMTAFASVESAVAAIRNGAIDYIIKPFKLNELKTSIQRALNETRIIPSLLKKDGEFSARYQVRNMIGTSKVMQDIHRLIEKCARTSSTALVTGESGTGKELVARAIHYNSRRKNQPFVSINCAALPEALLESELFGHEKGSFTGAIATKIGLMELADKGTFFLDEIAEISPPIQVKLLRVLQEKIIKRVGGLEDIPVDVRVIAATSCNLGAAVKDGHFRHELYYRLNVIPIVLPPLRERRDDIPQLIHYFIDQFSKKMGLTEKVSIDSKALSYLQSHDWPGNIRELENVVERILALSDTKSIGFTQVEEALSNEPINSVSNNITSSASADTLKNAVEEYERQLIGNALKATSGNKLKAARQLGLTRQSLQYKLKKFGWK